MLSLSNIWPIIEPSIYCTIFIHDIEDMTAESQVKQEEEWDAFANAFHAQKEKLESEKNNERIPPTSGKSTEMREMREMREDPLPDHKTFQEQEHHHD